MGIPVILLFLTVLMLVRVKAQAELTACDGVYLALGLSCLGISKQWKMQTGGESMILDDGGAARILQPSFMHNGFGRMLRIMKRSDKARQLLLHHTTLHHLALSARIHGHDAARTALLTGVIRALCGFLPTKIRRSSRFQVIPGFHDAPSAIQLRCIISCRAGILFITAALLGIASLREKLAAGKEE